MIIIQVMEMKKQISNIDIEDQVDKSDRRAQLNEWKEQLYNDTEDQDYNPKEKRKSVKIQVLEYEKKTISKNNFDLDQPKEVYVPEINNLGKNVIDKKPKVKL